LISEQQKRIATECLPRIEVALQEIDSPNKDCVELNSKGQLTTSKTMETREQLKKLNEDSLNIIKVIESLDKMLMDMNEQTKDIRSKSMTRSNLMDADYTYTLKVNMLLILNDDSHKVHSDPFQSSQWGYKMGISMAIQTDEQNKQRSIVVSFIIFRGDYDSILHWPFSYPITICLVDLTGTRKHVIHSIQPDSQIAIYGRPIDNANIPYEIPQFCPIEKVLENASNYICDDSIYLRIHIDFTKTGVHPF
jgi:hypothetical protein